MSTSNFNESDVRRQKSGQPTGGQFAEKERAASGLALTGQAGGLPAPGSEEAEPWNYDGDPEVDKTIDQALQQAARTGDGYAPKLRATMAIHRAAQEQIERMSAGLVAQIVRERYPDARYVILEPSDQGDYWEGDEIVGDDRENIGEWEDIAEDYESEAVALSNFDSEKSYPFIVPVVAGRTCYFDLDAAEKYAAS